MTDTVFADACALAAAIRRGEVSARDAVDRVLDRIARMDDDLNAYALVDADGARAAADAADVLQADGDDLGPLHGVPFSVKDLIDTEGLETACGSYLMAGNIPARDATTVARLKSAGAILIGKTTTPEFAHKALTTSPRYGVTRNPWNLTRSPGGSTGGGAASVAAGLAPLALATDGAGSARIPASCCGVLGLKATLGRIPNEGAADLFGNFIYHGAITRTTADLAAMVNVISGPDAGDPWTTARENSPLTVPDDPVKAMAGVRLTYLPLMGNRKLDPRVDTALRQTLYQLATAGADVGEWRESEPDDWGNELARVTIRAPLSIRMARFSPEQHEQMDPSLRQAIEESEALDQRAVQAAPLQRTALFHRVETLFAEADLLITPTVSAPPPSAEHEAWEPLRIDGRVVGPLRATWYNYPAPFNLTGHPAISIPCGWDDEGLPIGLQAVAPWHEDQRLIDLAAAIEVLQPWTDRWPDLATQVT
jgi:aspartyl-tRNA(Asn)/glutamyl-tRNA(Gln) amidotransferase subunit A